MGIHQLRVTLGAALGLALAAGSALALAARTEPPSLSDARVCHPNMWNPILRECSSDEPDRLAGAAEYDCSVRYRASGQTAFEARLLYEGQVQRRYTTTVSDSGTQAIGIRFESLSTDAALPTDLLPGGRYRCEFLLGEQQTTVDFASHGPDSPLLAPLVCETFTTVGHACEPYYGSDAKRPIIGPTHSVTCSAVLARLQGHAVEIDFLRAGFLVYAAKDTLQAPITNEWAHTSAPPGRNLEPGPYRCRFLVDGQVAAERPFAIAG